jgi:tripartite-type tricarboxylate transporter receptor subunit TctC
MLTAGAELQPGTPEEFARTLKVEIAKWGKLVREAKITAD